MQAPRCFHLPSGHHFAAAVAVGIAAMGIQARADSGAARQAYDQGADAYRARDFPLAARLFARADELAPNAVALKLALAASIRADDAVLGMALVHRADTRKEVEVADLAREGRRRFQARAGYVRIVCRPEHGCRARIGERTASGGEVVVVAPGTVPVVFEDVASLVLRVGAGVTIDAVEPAPEKTVEAPPAFAALPGTPEIPPASLLSMPPGSEAPRESRLTPALFWGGVALTGVLAAATGFAAFDMKRQHDAFVMDPTAETQARGVSAERRTNLLLGATLASGVATAIAGIFYRGRKGSSQSQSAGAPP